jgi:hypothetical protein
MPYLDTPVLTVQSRNGCRDMSGGNEAVYSFRLSGAADRTWCDLFKRAIDGVNAAVSGALLEIQCIPANLESHYFKAKEAIRQTNVAYGEHKLRIMHDVEQMAIQRDQKQRAEEARRQTLRDQFDKLEL